MKAIMVVEMELLMTKQAKVVEVVVTAMKRKKSE